MNRRRFLRRGLGSLVGTWLVPRIISRRALAAPGRPEANDTLRIGLIGCGIRGKYLIGNLPPPGANDVLRIGLIGCGIRGKYLIGNLPPEGRVMAICDCYAPRMAGTLKPEAGSQNARVLSQFLEHDAARCTTYGDYRRMLDEAALDAIIIATPDHHHAHAAMLACQAGLDVYCEKPLTLTITEGQRLIQAVRNHRRVLQVGSQQRSMEMDRFAC
ncbi:MAG: Gfo/Idh/MocA family oxidoreductase, partial [Pirellulaceae bacterium]|nr:Gfo/Idh/MocA family oxidoreductase [Pirellulaceae bacterium]